MVRIVDGEAIGHTTGIRAWAKRPFTYDGRPLDRGQVFRMIGARNDRRLLELNYCGLVADGDDLYTCALDGAEFIDLATRDAHGRRVEDERRRADAGRPLTPMEEDQRADRLEKQLAEVAPVGRGVAKK